MNLLVSILIEEKKRERFVDYPSLVQTRMMIKDIIDSKFWMKVFLANKEEVSEIKQTCQIAGL